MSNAETRTAVGAGGNIHLTGDLELSSRLNNIADADTNVFSFGAAAVGATITKATANGDSTTEFGGNVTGARDITVEA